MLQLLVLKQVKLRHLKFERQRGERQKKRFKSTQVALFAKSGVKIDGSLIDVISDSAAEIEADILTRDFNLRTQQTQAQSRVRAFQQDAGAAGIASIINPTRTIIKQLPNFNQKNTGAK